MTDLFQRTTKVMGTAEVAERIHYPACYALVSGGKDSLTTAQMLHEAGKLIACVAFETGVSTPDWKEFVIKTCAERGWPLEFYKTDASYDDLVRRYGFPGGKMHGMFMNYLKGRCVRKFKRQHKDGILASGVRKNESGRRKITTKEISVWESVPVLAPIFHMLTDQVWAYFRSRGFERAPAYSTLQISGDCLCGSFADEDEPQHVAFHYPEINARFARLATEIDPAILRKHPKRCRWGWGYDEKPGKTAKEAAICVECGDADAPDMFKPVAA